MLNVEAVFQDMIAFDPDRRRTNHLLKVQAYAEMIGRCEGMDEEDLFWLRIAALLHDIGIKPSLEKYESTAGPYQQREGSPLARDLLTRLRHLSTGWSASRISSRTITNTPTSTASTIRYWWKPIFSSIATKERWIWAVCFRCGTLFSKPALA